MLRIFICTILIVFFSQNCVAKIYKWVDENGQIHYSSQKPVNQDVETVKVRKGPKVKAKPVTESTEEQQTVSTDDTDADPNATARKQLADVDVVNRKKQCDLARKNSAALNATVRVVRTNEKGETVRMSDDERVSALAGAQRGIEEYCN